MKHTRFIQLIASALTLAGCAAQPATTANIQEYQRPMMTSQEPTPHKLRRAPVVNHTINRSTLKGGQYFFDSHTYNATFAPMSQAQFDVLKATYGSWSASKSQVKWRANTAFQLTDFLPPIIQATHGLTFQQQDFSVTLPNLVRSAEAPQAVNTILVSNCWGTVFELLRHAQQPQSSFEVFYAPHDPMKKWFLSELKTVRPLSFAASDFADALARNQNLQPGDVVMIGDKYIQHMAIYIDDDLFFEKAGVGPTALYRLTHWDVLAKTWDPTFYGYRYLRQSGKKLAEPMKVFGIENTFAPESFRGIPASLRSHLSAEVTLSDDTNTPNDVAYAIDQQIPLIFDPQSKVATLPPWALSALEIKSKITALLSSALEPERRP